MKKKQTEMRYRILAGVLLTGQLLTGCAALPPEAPTETTASTETAPEKPTLPTLPPESETNPPTEETTPTEPNTEPKTTPETEAPPPETEAPEEPEPEPAPEPEPEETDPPETEAPTEETVPETEAPPPETEAPEEPEAVEDWKLLLVNPWSYVPWDFSLELSWFGNGEAVDSRIYGDLMEMLSACEAAGLEPLVCSSYRTWGDQQELFDNKVQRLMDEGYDREEAEEIAATVVAVPGTSEHQTGLAVDIVDINYQMLDEGQESTPVQQWLMANSWEYGFVLRYPNNKSWLTGIIYEPWHYRYVGREAAREMYQSGQCLEEYLGWG